MTRRRPNREFSDAVKQVWHSLKGLEDKPVSQIKDDLAAELVKRDLQPERSREGDSNPFDYWGKGFIPSNPRVVDFLAEVGVGRARLPKDWLDRFLRSAGYSEPVRRERERALYGLPEGADKTLPPDLPPPDYPEFVGREKELMEVKRLLRPYPAGIHHVITIAGVAGVGKTALAREIACHYLHQRDSLTKDERFEVIIWFSAKTSSLTATGIRQRLMVDRTLDDLYRKIALQLGKAELLDAATRERDQLLRRELQTRRTLLIIDNLESVDDERLLAFLTEPPAPTKIIVTTRLLIEAAYPVRVLGMNLSDAMKLIDQCAKSSGDSLATGQKQALFTHTGGVPLALLWSVAQILNGYSFDSTLRRLGDSKGDFARFCYQAAMEPLRGSAPHKLLMALTFFSEGADRDALGQIAALQDDVVGRDDGLVRLETLSLVNRRGHRYHMLPLTRQFACSELASSPHFDAQAFDRWVEWVIQSTAATAELVAGQLMFKRDRQIKSMATDRVWLLNASTREISVRQELDWVNRQPGDAFNRLFCQLDILRHHVAQLHYYDDLVKRALDGQFHYIRIIQCPEGEITPENTGSHYLRHLRRMVGTKKAKTADSSLTEALLYEAEPRRNKTFAIIDQSHILIQETDRRADLDRMAALRIIYDPPAEVLDSFEFIFQEVLRSSTRLSRARVEALHSSLVSLYDEFREPVEETLRQLLTIEESDMVERAADLVEEMRHCEHPEMTQIVTDVIADLRADSKVHSKIQAVIRLVETRNPETW